MICNLYYASECKKSNYGKHESSVNKSELVSQAFVNDPGNHYVLHD